MEIVTTKTALRAALRERRGGGAAVALVPTMGALHPGHLALIDAVRPRSACVVVSIFVNPLQFGPKDDFAAYPRDLDRDAALARDRHADLVFAPSVAEMYPTPSTVSVVPVAAATGQTALDARWEGAARPGHFAGVLTVVAKLFNLVRPDLAAFGRKDLQQVTLIRSMVRDLDFAIEIVTVPTVRAADGLALSSRNTYLSSAERARALVIPRALDAMLNAWADHGVREAATLTAVGRRILDGERDVAVEYLGLAEPVQLTPVVQVEPGSVAMIAARVGRTRLIDNVVFSAGGGPS
jgi:pantoate--beta-alanine ligase